MKHRLQQKDCFSFPSFAKVRGSKSRNEQKRQYHILVKMSAINHRNALNTNFVMNLLTISENQGSKLQFLTKTTFYISVGQNSRTMFSKKKKQIVLSLDFSVSVICSNTKSS